MDVKKMIKMFLIALLIFILVFSVLRHGFKKDYVRGKPVLKKLNKEKKYVDNAYIVEESEKALDVRINMLDDAEDTVDIAYYKIDTGETSKIFISKVLETAERGVKVRIYLDGILNNLTGNIKNANYTFANHPNIEYRLHQPLNLLKPWTFNDRLHDKIIIVDGKLALIGGRNIGDRFFITDFNDRRSVLDRDILIYNERASNKSVVKDMEDYFNLLWNSEKSKEKFAEISKTNREKGDEFLNKLLKYWNQVSLKDYSFNRDIDWGEITQPIGNAELIHNPLDPRDDPTCLMGILELSELANNQLIMQSPYIIMSKNMDRVVKEYDINYDKMDILTNSYYSTPNIMAVSGYHNIRKEIVDQVNQVYEYHEGNSIHGKSYIFDDKISVIGSFNLDPRSAYLSSEAYLVIYDEDLSQDLKSNMKDLKNNSLEVSKDYGYTTHFPKHDKLAYKIKKFLIIIISKLVYFFDYML